MNPYGCFLVYTDGSCWHIDRIGSYAWLVVDEEGVERTGGGFADDTTISRMELQAPIDVLECILMMAGPSAILVHSDSEYVVKGATDRRRKRTINQDLWERLDWLVDQHEHVEFEHVKGHNGHHYNERVDRLAHDFRKEGQSVYIQGTS